MAGKLKILYASAEVVPFAKTGGLADVAGALPQTLADMGHDVRVVLPLYRGIDAAAYGLRPVAGPFAIPHGHGTIEVSIEESDAIPGVTTYFIRNDYLYDRDSLYGQADDDHRFIAYSRAILEMLPELGWFPDVINCNDWHTGLVPVYLKTLYADRKEFARIGSVYTIHNLAYQGVFSPHIMALAGLPGELFTWDKLEYYGQFNFMKAGLLYADQLSTVSPTYAKEIQTEEFGEGLEGVMTDRAKELTGILNGIDYTVWHPETDPLLPARFSPADLAGKAECKRALQKAMGLAVTADAPLFGLISRLSYQKGLDVLDAVLPTLLEEQDMQLVVLGTGDEHYHNMLTRLAKAHPEKLAVALRFDNALAHLIYAGSDAFLMPSRYEPCGLGQMISLAYGTIPVVRATGGLADSVCEFHSKKPEAGNGFVFQDMTEDALSAAMMRTMLCYGHRTGCWDQIVQNAFRCDFSWANSARKYVTMYNRAVRAVRGNGKDAKAA